MFGEVKVADPAPGERASGDLVPVVTADAAGTTEGVEEVKTEHLPGQHPRVGPIPPGRPAAKSMHPQNTPRSRSRGSSEPAWPTSPAPRTSKSNPCCPPHRQTAWRSDQPRPHLGGGVRRTLDRRWMRAPAAVLATCGGIGSSCSDTSAVARANSPQSAPKRWVGRWEWTRTERVFSASLRSRWL